MEIRGIGIIDIRAMYGIGAVAQSKSIDLVIHMEKWVEGKEYDRLGLNDELHHDSWRESTQPDHAGAAGAQPRHHHRGGGAQLVHEEARFQRRAGA